jgi:hypothetical protein
MNAARDLRTYLLADTTLAGLIGTRMFPGAIPQSADMPAVAYHQVSAGHLGSLGGIVAPGEVRIQLDSHAATRLVANQVAAAIVARLGDLSQAGPTKIGGTSGTPVCDVEVSGPRDDEQPPGDGSDNWQYIASVDAVLTLGG